MKNIRTRRGIQTFAALTAAGLYAAAGSAQTSYTWIGAGTPSLGSTTWNVGSNWSGGTGVSFPGILDIANFPNGGSVNGGAAGTINVPAGQALVLQGTTTLDGFATISGTLTFTLDNSDGGAFGVLDRRLFVPAGATTTLANEGQTLLNGFTTGLQGGDRATSLLRVFQFHTITGFGALSDLSLDNGGTIDANGGTIRFINVDYGDTGGTVNATTGGLLFQNTSGSGVEGVLGDETTLTLNSGTALNQTGFVGGENVGISITSAMVSSAGTNFDLLFDTQSGSLTGGSESTPGIADGNWNNAGLQAFAGHIQYDGTITNNGTLTYQVDNSNNGNAALLDQRFSIADGGEMTLNGTGSFVFSGLATGIEGISRAGSQLNQGADHTITGLGVIDNLSMRNEGTVNGTGTFTISATDVDNDGGEINQTAGTMTISNSTVTGGAANVGAGSTMLFTSSPSALDTIDSAGSLRITNGSLGGTLTTTDGSVIGGAESGQSLSGNWHNTGTLAVGGGIEYTGTLTNTGTMTLTSDASNNGSSAIFDQRISIAEASAATFTGSGTFNLNGSATGIQGVDQTSVLTNTGGHRISGFGGLNKLHIENAGGVISNTSTLSMTDVTVNGGVLDFAPGQLVNLNDVQVAGSLVVSAGTLRFNSASSFTGVNLTTTGGLLDALDEGTTSVLAGTWTNTGPLTIREAISFDGLLNNTGNIAFLADASNGGSSATLDNRIFIPSGGTVAASGVGSISLAGSATGIQGVGAADSTLINTGGHIITGFGEMRDLTIRNEAMIDPSGNMIVRNAVLDNTGGTITQTSGTLTLINSTFTAGDIQINASNGLSFINSTVGVDSITADLGAAVRINSTDVTGIMTTQGGVLDAFNEVGQSFTGTWNNNGAITFEDGLTVSGTLNNNGVITFLSDNSNNGSSAILDQRIAIAANDSLSVSGTGSIVLNGNATGIQGVDETSVFNHAAGHTITGSGILNKLTIDGPGLITQTGALRFDDVLVIDGQLNFIAGQTVDLFSSAFENVSMTTAGTLRFQSTSSLTGSVLTTLDGALVSGVDESEGKAVIDSVWHVQGPTLVQNGLTLANALGGSAVIENDSMLTFLADASNNGSAAILDQRLIVPDGGTLTLERNGSVVLNGSATGIQGTSDATSTLINTPLHTITGFGTLSKLTIAGTGLISNTDYMVFDDTRVTDARLEFVGGETVDLFSAEFDGVSMTTAGTLRFRTPSSLINSSLTTQAGAAVIGIDESEGNAVIDNNWHVQGPTTVFNAVTFSNTAGGAATLRNDSSLTFPADSSNNGSPGILDQRLVIPENSTLVLEGGGAVALNGSATGIQGHSVPASTLVNSNQHKITGRGTLDDLTLNNNGTIAPTGDIALQDVTLNNTSGRIQIIFGPSGTGRIVTSGSFTAQGTIDIGFEGRFRPDPNATFAIVNAGGPIFGAFGNTFPDGDGIANVSTANGTFTIFYPQAGDPNQITITNVLSSNGPSADFDDNGVVDIFDWLAYLNAFTNGEQAAEADGVPGLTDQDVFAFQATFNAFAN